MTNVKEELTVELAVSNKGVELRFLVRSLQLRVKGRKFSVNMIGGIYLIKASVDQKENLRFPWQLLTFQLPIYWFMAESKRLKVKINMINSINVEKSWFFQLNDLFNIKNAQNEFIN